MFVHHRLALLHRVESTMGIIFGCGFRFGIALSQRSSSMGLASLIRQQWRHLSNHLHGRRLSCVSSVFQCLAQLALSPQSQRLLIHLLADGVVVAFDGVL